MPVLSSYRNHSIDFQVNLMGSSILYVLYDKVQIPSLSIFSLSTEHDKEILLTLYVPNFWNLHCFLFMLWISVSLSNNLALWPYFYFV